MTDASPEAIPVPPDSPPERAKAKPKAKLKTAGKAPRRRAGRRPHGAVRFPVYDLGDSIEVVRRLHHELGGSASAPEMAARLGYSGIQNGAFINRLASARMFGLLEGTAERLMLSERAKSILMPEDESMEASALADAFEAVPVFKAFYDAYDGRSLPAHAGRINALQTRFEVPADRSANVLSRLERSAERAGYFRVASDRMIRPRTSGRRPAEVSNDLPDPGATTARPSGTGRRGADHLLMQGAFAELPPTSEQWKEEGLEQWLELVETAARVIYKLPRRHTTSNPNGTTRQPAEIKATTDS
jgi:hypothetical protein